MYSVALSLDGGVQEPESIRLYFNAMERDESDTAAPLHILARSGESFSVASDGWRIDMTVRQGDTADQVWLAGKLYKDKALVSTPTLLTRLGEQATVRVGDGDALFSLAMKVTAKP